MAESVPHGGQMIWLSDGACRIDIDRRTAFNIINNFDNGRSHLQLGTAPLIFGKSGGGRHYDIQPKSAGIDFGVCCRSKSRQRGAAPDADQRLWLVGKGAFVDLMDAQH